MQSVQRLVLLKTWSGNDSNTERFSYFIATSDIISKHSLSVGYQGFYDAMVETDIYKSSIAATELIQKESNPHLTFLWYTSTGGIIGAGLSIMLMLLLLRIIKIDNYSAFGRTGFVFFSLIAGSMCLIGLTVPYLFNSTIFFRTNCYRSW